jgi:hypothetical protein
MLREKKYLQTNKLAANVSSIRAREDAERGVTTYMKVISISTTNLIVAQDSSLPAAI